jgi:hypothetical protein
VARLRAGVAGESETAGRTRVAGPVGLKPAPTLGAQRVGASTPGGRSWHLNAQANGPGMPGPTRCHSTTGNALTLRPTAGRRQRPNRPAETARDRKSPPPPGSAWGKLFRQLSSEIVGLRDLRDQIATFVPTTDDGWRARFKVCLAGMGDAENETADEAFIRATLHAFWAGGAGDQGGVGSRATTGTQTGSQQTNIPATGSSAVGMPGPTVQPSYPGTVGPTGSNQPDATNPDRSSPAGGGGGGK